MLGEPVEYPCPERSFASKTILQVVLDARQIAHRNAKYFETDLTKKEIRRRGEKILATQENSILQFLATDRFDQMCFAIGLDEETVKAFIHGVLSGEKIAELENQIESVVDSGKVGSGSCRLRKRKTSLQLQLT